MAVVTRRYRNISSTDANLQEFVAPSAALVAQYVNAVDINVDNAVGGTTETLDEYMATLGYVFDAAAPASLTGLVGLENWWWNKLVNASAVNAVMNVGPATAYQEIIMPRAGYFLQATSYSRLTIPAAGTVTFQIVKAATPTGVLAAVAGASWMMDLINPRGMVAPFTPGLYTFAANEKVGIWVTTNASTGSNDYSVTLEVVYAT